MGEGCLRCNGSGSDDGLGGQCGGEGNIEVECSNCGDTGKISGPDLESE